MRRLLIVVVMGLTSLLLATSTFAAAAAKGTSADSPVAKTIESKFNVTEDQLATLRSDKLGYGEIVIVLTLAQSMPGGITSDTINQVLQLRNGPPVTGWGKLARDLGLNLGDIVSKVAKTVNQSTDAIAKAQAASSNGKSSGASSGAGERGPGGSAGQGTGSGSAGSSGSDKRP